MSTDVSVAPMGPVVKKGRRSRREVIYRHTFFVRLTHWINALAIFLIICTGLNIFNAHSMLYWGQKGDNYDPSVMSIKPAVIHGAVRGITQVGPFRFDTTGVLGWSQSHGRWMGRAWPSWITVPSFQDLADARHWHFFFAWVLILNGVAYLAWSLLVRHLQRDLWPTWSDLKTIPRSVWEHVRNKHPTGEEAKRYNVLQKLAYLGLIALVLGMVATGLTLSPGIDAFAPWLLDLFGGRQSARTLHFVFASAIALFIFVHVAEVFLAGPINEVRSILTGNYHVPPDRQPKAPKVRGRG